eukprot:TRINITY_DN21732_c0_g1_i3.p1 TRINITY_DN21732_c0_g1~~TRINITY_DN21732_c0_g1_i3.p1  ORF type:complete len:463 (+),score=114.44 TRINITY_DN21732_c0_g1_i3:119-1507(+)
MAVDTVRAEPSKAQDGRSEPKASGTKELPLLWKRLNEREADCARLESDLRNASLEWDRERALLQRKLTSTGSKLRAQESRAQRAEVQCLRLRKELAAALGLPLSPELTPQTSPRGEKDPDADEDEDTDGHSLTGLKEVPQPSSPVAIEGSPPTEATAEVAALRRRVIENEAERSRLETELRTLQQQCAGEVEKAQKLSHENCCLSSDLETCRAEKRSLQQTLTEQSAQLDEYFAMQEAAIGELSEPMMTARFSAQQVSMTARAQFGSLEGECARLRRRLEGAHAAAVTDIARLRRRCARSRRQTRLASWQAQRTRRRCFGVAQGLENERLELEAWRADLTKWWEEHQEQQRESCSRLASEARDEATPSETATTEVETVTSEDISLALQNCSKDSRRLAKKGENDGPSARRMSERLLHSRLVKGLKGTSNFMLRGALRRGNSVANQGATAGGQGRAPSPAIED